MGREVLEIGPEYFLEVVIYGILSEHLDDEELGKVVKALSFDPGEDDPDYDLKDDKLNCIYRLAHLLKVTFK